MIMNAENQELMMKDLCARLPYGVVLTDGINKLKLKVRLDTAPGTMEEFFRTDTLRYYLRPLKLESMTLDERMEYDKFVNGDNTVETHANEIDWLNAHHFDYRGLIQKGLALEASEGMYD